MTLKAPFPYFGGKSAVASVVWRALGDCMSYVEPFFGSGAVLLARPASHQWWDRIETVNDADDLVSNFWRAVQSDPSAVARAADWPVIESDLHARHAWLVGQKGPLRDKLEGNPDWYDAKIAGWWVWGICAWIGSGWCSGKGPWMAVDGKLVVAGGSDDSGRGIQRRLLSLGDSGRGINRNLPGLGSTNKSHCAAWSEYLREMMQNLQDRLRRVRICCGDWSRVLGYSPTTKLGVTGVFLDPPYTQSERAAGIYNIEMETPAGVGDWCRKHGGDPLLRVALCGYDGEHDLPGWRQWRWKARGGYSNRWKGVRTREMQNRERECIWFSPACLDPGPGQQLILDVGAIEVRE